MTLANILIWVASDLVFGLLHLLVFGLITLLFKFHEGQYGRTKRELWKGFLATGVFFAYAVTLLATHLGQLGQSWYNVPEGLSNEQRLVCVALLIAGLVLAFLSGIALSAIILTDVGGSSLTWAAPGSATRTTLPEKNPRMIVYLSIFIAFVAGVIAFFCIEMSMTITMAETLTQSG